MVSEEGTSEYGLQLLTVPKYVNTLPYRLLHSHANTHSHVFVLLLHFALVCDGIWHFCSSRLVCICVCLIGWFVDAGLQVCFHVSVFRVLGPWHVSHSILTVDVWWWTVYHPLTAMRFLDSRRLSLSSLPHLVHFAHFHPLPLIPLSFPLVNLLLSRFSDKKLERGKWNFALVYFLFLSLISVLSVSSSS